MYRTKQPAELYQIAQTYEQRIQSTEKELETLRYEHDSCLISYRIASVCRVLDYIQCVNRAGKLSEIDLDKLLVHCHNKLNGNIDGIELKLELNLKQNEDQEGEKQNEE